MNEEISKRIGDYEILNELGAGGMGCVYRVRNVISDRIEAMKILLPDLAGRQVLAARFLREIKLLASLDHPNIAQLHTAFTHEDRLVMIMEYVEGTSMAVRLTARPVTVAEALDYIDQVLNALGFAHQHNVIHRDIKPGNMMLTPQGIVKVMDFGIARSDADRTLTLTGTSLGTINYMFPEQVKGEATDPRSDLYSVGVCLYEMVTGKKPFETGSDYAIMTAHVNEVPRPPIELQPGLPDALNEIILVAIAKDPAERFQTAAAFRNALNNARGLAPTVDMPAAVFADTSSSSAGYESVPSPVTSASPVSPSAAARVTSKVTPLSDVPPPLPSPPSSSHRGLYMTLGALIVLAGLVLAGIYIPKKGNADERTQKTVTNPAPVEPPPSVVEVPDTPPPPPVVLAKEGAKLRSRQGGGESGPNLEELEDEIDHLAARAGSVNSSLDRLKQQQASAGYGLRGDMVEHQESMKINLSRAQDAAEHGDAAKAKKYADRTTADLEALERFLGR